MWVDETIYQGLASVRCLIAILGRLLSSSCTLHTCLGGTCLNSLHFAPSRSCARSTLHPRSGAVANERGPDPAAHPPPRAPQSAPLTALPQPSPHGLSILMPQLLQPLRDPSQRPPAGFRTQATSYGWPPSRLTTPRRSPPGTAVRGSRSAGPRARRPPASRSTRAPPRSTDCTVWRPLRPADKRSRCATTGSLHILEGNDKI